MTESWEYPQHKEVGKVPALNEIDYSDRLAVLDARDKRIREQWVRLMETRILREKLAECYDKEGVNHRQNCRHLAVRYVDRLKDSHFKSWNTPMSGIDYEDASSQ